MPPTFPKSTALRGEAERLGFTDPDAVADALSPRLAASFVEKGQAAELVRSFAGERPELLTPGAVDRWSAAEVYGLFRSCVRSGNRDEATRLLARHGTAIEMAKRAEARDREELDVKRFARDQRIGVLRHEHAQAEFSARGLEQALHVTDGLSPASRQDLTSRALAARAKVTKIEAEIARVSGDTSKLEQLQQQVHDLDTQIEALRGQG